MTLGTRSGIRKRETVLVADDEAALRLLVHTIIDSPFYRVVEASDGEEAWTLIKERKPAVVLLDSKMPRRSGLKLLTAIRADRELESTRVIMLTSSQDRGDVDASTFAGADFYLNKPFSPTELLARVTEAIERRVVA